jgi:hypothetical protein
MQLVVCALLCNHVSCHAGTTSLRLGDFLGYADSKPVGRRSYSTRMTHDAQLPGAPD